MTSDKTQSKPENAEDRHSQVDDTKFSVKRDTMSRVKKYDLESELPNKQKWIQFDEFQEMMRSKNVTR